MDVYAIPVEPDTFILYRPRLPLAFVGNKALAELALARAAGGPASDGAATAEADAFLDSVGFFQPDPPPLAPPADAFQPTTAVLLLTNRCQLRCVYCYANAGIGPAQKLPLELAHCAIDCVCRNAEAQGRREFQLNFHGGGEPSLAWSTVQAAVDYARHKPLPAQISIVTNGVWSGSQRDWITANLDAVSLSLDGGRLTQDRQRPMANGRGSFELVLRSLRTLDQRGFAYGVRMTATAPWRGQLAEDVRFLCEETGCRSIQVEPAFNTARGEHGAPGYDDCAAFVEGFMEAFAIARGAGRTLYYSGARPWVQTPTFCTAPYNALIVTPTGDLVSCYEITDAGHPLAARGRIGRIVEGEVQLFAEVREALLGNLAERRAQCDACFCQWHCAGDCFARTFAPEPGSHMQFGLRCRTNRAITAQILLWYIMEGDGVWRGQFPQTAGVAGAPERAYLLSEG